MLEHLYKGKRIDNGEWAEGSFVKFDTAQLIFTGDTKTVLQISEIMLNHDYSKSFKPVDRNVRPNEIFLPCFYTVFPETICQYTGREINGVKMWENDLIIRNKDNHEKYIAKIVWNNEKSMWSFHFIGDDILIPLYSMKIYGFCSIIGSAFDHQEIVEGNHEVI